MDKSLKQYQSKFRYKFDMDSKAIDLREMCKNFPSVDDRNGFIPLEKINEAINNNPITLYLWILSDGACNVPSIVQWLDGSMC